MRDPGWYPDGAGEVRYWDGVAWTPLISIPGDDAIGRSEPTVLGPPTGLPVSVMSHPPTRAEIIALTGFLGLAIGVIAVFLPFAFGLVGGLIGLALSIVGAAERGPSRPWAIAGMVASALAIVLIF